MRDGWLERDGVRLHWREWAPAEPAPERAVFCLHGLSSNSLYWERLAARLPGRRIVALDQRSHGLSDRPSSGYAFADLAADAIHAIHETGLERPILLGHSWGAAVALAVAALPDTPVAALGHLDGPLTSFSGFMSWDQASVLMQPPLRHYADLAEAVAEQRGYLEDGWGDDLTGFVEAGLVADGDGFALTLTAEIRLQILKELYAFRPEGIWPQLHGLPVLIAAADKSPAAIAGWKRQSIEQVGRLLPDAVVRWFPSGHDIPVHLPAQVAAAVEELSTRILQ